MSRNGITFGILVFSITLLPAIGAAEQPRAPAPPRDRQERSAQPELPPDWPNEGPRAAGEAAKAKADAKSPWGSASTTTATPPWAGAPLAYSALRSEVALRVEELMRGAAALRTHGNFAKAMELHNEALTLAPQYGEGYRQRALTLVRLGDRMRAQVDYNRYLALDRQAASQVREELALFQQSGFTRSGEIEAASYSYGPSTAASTSESLPAVNSSLQQLADVHFSWAQEAFRGGDYDLALRRAMQSNEEMPQARTHALTAQIFFARGNFPAATTEARAAAVMGPMVNWQTLFGFYGYATPPFSQQLRALEEFVAENPSSADGHFLLGYQRLVLGHADAAHAQLAIASVIEPNDVAATALLAKEGVEIVSSRRPLAPRSPLREGAEVARRLPAPMSGAGPSPASREGVPPAPESNQPKVIR